MKKDGRSDEPQSHNRTFTVVNVLLFKALQTQSPTTMPAITEGQEGHVPDLVHFMKGSVYLMIESAATQSPLPSPPLHSPQTGLAGQMVTINHHLSADLRVARDSLRGPQDATVLNSCLILSILPSPAPSPESAFVSSPVETAPLSLSAHNPGSLCSRGLRNDLNVTISPALPKRLILL